MIKEFVAVILAGGESSRFARTVEGNLPPDKLLAELVDGKTAIDLTIERLVKFGISKHDMIIVTSPSKYDAFRQKYSANHVILQPEAKGNADAATQAIPELKRKSEDAVVILVQGDDSFTYDESDYQQLINGLFGHDADVAVMTLDPQKEWDEKTRSFWQVEVSKDSIVKSITKERSETTQALVNAFAIRTRAFIKYMVGLEPNPLEKNEKILPDFMQAVLTNGGTIVAVPTDKFLGFNDFFQFTQARHMIQSNQ